MSVIGPYGNPVELSIDIETGKLVITPVSEPVAKQAFTQDDIGLDLWTEGRLVRDFTYVEKLGVIRISRQLTIVPKGTSINNLNYDRFSNNINANTKVYYSLHDINNSEIHVLLLKHNNEAFMICISDAIQNGFLRISRSKWNKKAKPVIESPKPTVAKKGILFYAATDIPEKIANHGLTDEAVKENIAFYNLSSNKIEILVNFGRVFHIHYLNDRMEVHFADGKRTILDGDIVSKMRYGHRKIGEIDFSTKVAKGKYGFINLLLFLRQILSNITPEPTVQVRKKLSDSLLSDSLDSLIKAPEPEDDDLFF